MKKIYLLLFVFTTLFAACSKEDGVSKPETIELAGRDYQFTAQISEIDSNAKMQATLDFLNSSQFTIRAVHYSPNDSFYIAGPTLWDYVFNEDSKIIFATYKHDNVIYDTLYMRYYTDSITPIYIKGSDTFRGQFPPYIRIR
jgi:hypothetical protein